MGPGGQAYDCLGGIGDHPTATQDRSRANHLPVLAQGLDAAELAVFFENFLGVGLPFVT